MKKTIAALTLFLALCAGSLSAQVLPSNNLLVAKKNRIVVVDSSGVSGDFKTLAAAFAWVSAQTRSLWEQWVVYVRPGKLQTGNVNYIETTPLVVPTYTSVIGVPTQDLASYNSYSGQPVIGLSGTSGALVTLSTNSSVNGLTLLANTSSLTGALKVLSTGGTGAWVTNTTVIVNGTVPDTQAVTIVSNDSGALYLKNVSTARFNTATLSVSVQNNTTSGIVAELGRWEGGTSQADLVKSTASGGVRLRGVRLSTSTTNQLNTSAGDIYLEFTPIAKAPVVSGSGTVTYADVSAGKLFVVTQTPASASATCRVGQIAWDSGYVYVCTATDTWKRAAIATW